MHSPPIPTYVRFDCHYQYIIKLHLVQLVAVALVCSKEINLGILFYGIYTPTEKYHSTLSYQQILSNQLWVAEILPHSSQCLEIIRLCTLAMEKLKLGNCRLGPTTLPFAYKLVTFYTLECETTRLVFIGALTVCNTQVTLRFASRWDIFKVLRKGQFNT